MVQPFNWDLLQSFLAIARAGRLTLAARRLGIDHSTLSRRLATLEATLDATLFERTMAGYALTTQGEHLLKHAESIESSVIALQSDMADSRSTVSGVVRIGAPEGFGTAFLATVIGRLSVAHPGLDIQIVATPRNFSLSQREADIAITLARPSHGRLHARLLTEYELGIYAARDTPALWQDVATLDDCAGKPFISYIDDMIFTPELDYLSSISRDITPRIKSSNLIAQYRAAAAGAGLCVLPCFLVADDPRLMRLLNEVRLLRSFWLLVHSDMRDLARIRVTSDFIAEEARRARNLFLPALS
ncbi:LysR family transcriptional regulator [Pseudochelatococcus sp. G4_1912]|uniref:LysR family transcriptional regulator n=1 Tax=Pseudochelatococcus sp. G4_1912 TaxID=3114288 RepID=UPI0039C756F9